MIMAPKVIKIKPMIDLKVRVCERIMSPKIAAMGILSLLIRATAEASISFKALKFRVNPMAKD